MNSMLESEVSNNGFCQFSSLYSFPSKAVFEEVCDATLDSLTESFEELIENDDHLAGADVNYSVRLSVILSL